MKIDRDTLVRRLALGGVIVATTILSYATLKHRAVEIGFPEAASWFYPLAYDAMILAASRMWQNQLLSDSTRKLAKIATLGFIGAALAVFIAEFAPNGPMAVLFALPVPAALAFALVLTSRAAADRKAAAETPVDEPTEAEEELTPDPEPEPVSVAPEPSYAPVTVKHEAAPGNTETAEVSFTEIPTITLPETPFVPTDEKRAWIHAQLDNGVELTGAAIKAQFPDVGNNGSRLLKSVQKERTKRNGHARVTTS